MKTFVLIAALGSVPILVNLLIYSIGRRKLKTPDLFSWKASLVEWMFLTIAFYVMFGLVSFLIEREFTGFFIHFSIFVFLALMRSYPFLIEPILIFKNKNIERSLQIEEENKAILGGLKVYTFKEDLANAYAMGVLNFAQGIIISQDLVARMSPYELSGIIAHEVGHLKQRHLFKLYLAALCALLLGYMLSIYTAPFFEGLNINIHVARGIQGSIFFGIPFWLIPALYQRRLEYEADAFAAKLTSKACIKAALEKLDHITNGMVSKGGDTHPSLEKRLNFITKS